MRVYLIRHGRTRGNLSKRYIGRTDEPLCSQGFSDCLRAGTFTEIDRVYVSPMLRTRQTAVLMFPSAELKTVDDLREMDFGEFEGKNADEMESDAKYRAWTDGMCRGPCPGGEDFSGFTDRVNDAFCEIVESALRDLQKRIVIVAHGGTIMSIMSSFAVPERDYYDWSCGNCRCWRSELTFIPESRTLLLCDYSYLSELSF